MIGLLLMTPLTDRYGESLPAAHRRHHGPRSRSRVIKHTSQIEKCENVRVSQRRTALPSVNSHQLCPPGWGRGGAPVTPPLWAEQSSGARRQTEPAARLITGEPAAPPSTRSRTILIWWSVIVAAGGAARRSAHCPPSDYTTAERR